MVLFGRYTMFYFNGNIRETGKIAGTKYIDTTYVYDTTGKLEELILIGDDTSTYYYINNGSVKRFSPGSEK